MYAFGVVFSGWPIIYQRVFGSSESAGSKHDHDLLHGFSSLTLFIIVTQALNGFLYAAVMKVGTS